MTLTRLLEINPRLIETQELASIGFAERIWREHGCPTGVRELTDLLEKVLSECKQCGIRYAPIFLQRKKALHRVTWAPHIRIAPLSNESASSNDKCSRCGGSGYMPINGGRGLDLCPCEGWKRKRSDST
jgi:hypothetical protein